MYEEAALYREIDKLSPEKRITFAAACAEWLYPCYGKYEAETGEGSSSAIREAIDAAWCTADGGEISDVELHRLASQAESLVPPDDGDWSNLLPLAQNAAAAAFYATRVANSPEPQAVVWAARQIIEAGDYLAQMEAPVQTYVESADLTGLGRVASRAVSNLLETAKTSSPTALRSQAGSGGRDFCSLALGAETSC